MIHALVSSALAACLSAAPQQPDATTPHGFTQLANGLRLRAVPVEGADELGVAIVVGVGTDHDPSGQAGIAQALGRALAIVQEGLPAAHRFHVETHGSFTALSITVPATFAGSLRTRVVELLSGQLALEQDAADRAIAAAALAADDAQTRLPGTILESRARRALLAGTPQQRAPWGAVTELRQLTQQELQQRLREQFHPGQAVVVLLGAVTDELQLGWRDALAVLPRGSGAAVVAAQARAPLPPEPERITTFALTVAPYVTLAFRLPEPAAADYPAHLVAMAMLQVRAVKVLGTPRHAEMRARFPYMVIDYRDGDPLVLVNRRGEDFAPIDDAQQEIESVLQSFFKVGISPREVASAAEQVATTLSLPPYPPNVATVMARQPRLLAARAVTLAVAETRGWPADLPQRIRTIAVPAVQQALGAILGAERQWFALLPPARPLRGPSK